MSIETYDKELIATTQLNTAIEIFPSGSDNFSAITLAGAAEEILGKLVNVKGIDNSFESLQKAALKIHKLLFGSETTPKQIANSANRSRNAMKHLNATTGTTITFDAEENAKDMIDRAVENYWLLTESLTPAMERYQSATIGVSTFSQKLPD